MNATDERSSPLDTTQLSARQKKIVCTRAALHSLVGDLHEKSDFLMVLQERSTPATEQQIVADQGGHGHTLLPYREHDERVARLEKQAVL